MKRVTVHRDGSRKEQVLSSGSDCPDSNGPAPRGSPKLTFGSTTKVRVGCGRLYVTVNFDKEGPCEVITNLGRGGGCPAQSEAVSRVISIALRAGVDGSAIVRQLKGIVCQSCLKRKDVEALSCADAIARAISGSSKTVLPAESTQPDWPQSSTEGNEPMACPECGGFTNPDGPRCRVCLECGYSKCG